LIGGSHGQPNNLPKLQLFQKNKEFSSAFQLFSELFVSLSLPKIGFSDFTFGR